MVLPLWARVLERAGRAARVVQRADAVVREELLLAFLSPHHRDEYTFRSYSSLRAYLPGGATFEGGLFDWELALLEHPVVPRSGKVLLAGAGGGRELRALIERGYSVFGFEPAEALLKGARAVAEEGRRATCVQGRFADLHLAVRGQGPLAGAPAPFDLIYFGWGSFTHVTRAQEQLEVLQAALALGPRAPLILSFWVRQQPLDSKRDRFRRGVRRLLARLGGAEPDPGLVVHDECGFAYLFERSQLETLAARAGYRVALFAEEDFAHAVLSPQALIGEDSPR